MFGHKNPPSIVHENDSRHFRRSPNSGQNIITRRKTSLKAIVESALRRELPLHAVMENPDPKKFEMGLFDFLVLKKRPGEKPMTLEDIKLIQEAIDEECLQKSMQCNRR